VQFPTAQFLKKIRVAHVAILPKGSLAIKPTALPEGQNGGRAVMNFQLLSRWIEKTGTNTAPLHLASSLFDVGCFGRRGDVSGAS
jgi:hypothetical protein